MKQELLEKYLNNRYNDSEFRELVKWVIHETSAKESKSLCYDDWRSFAPELKHKNEKKYGALLDKIHHQINLKSDKDDMGRRRKVSKLVTLLGRVAAILFLPLLGVAFYLLSNQNIQSVFYSGNTLIDSLEIIAPVGSRTIVQLSDGSKVHLNYGSKIKYPRVFAGDTREVKLSGEGYFDVAHDPDKPFIVKTGQLNVTALGTRFNVQAYPGDNTISATLVEGKVLVEKTTETQKTERLGTMVPGQHAEYDMETGDITSSKGNIDKYVAWIDGKLVFDNEPITVVAEKLSRMFNVEIEVADNVKDLTYTVTFMNDPLFLILDLMTETTPVTYKTFPRKKLENGTYTKMKIKIEKKQ